MLSKADQFRLQLGVRGFKVLLSSHPDMERRPEVEVEGNQKESQIHFTENLELKFLKLLKMQREWSIRTKLEEQ
jgi:hypothetical protein